MHVQSVNVNWLRAAARKPPAAKPRFAAPKKAGAKAGGLGVKKMTTKVDDSLFDQAPVEDAPPAAAINALVPTLSVREPFSFFQDLCRHAAAAAGLH